MRVANVAIKSRKNFFLYKYLGLRFHSISPGWRYHKNNKNLVAIKSHTIYKNDKITFLRGPLKENEELF